MKFVKKYVKKHKPNKSNLLLVKARKGNSLNNRLIKKITKGRKSKGKRGKKTKRAQKRL